MIFENYLKSTLKPTNSGMLNISFWVITSIILIHFNTFMSFFKEDVDVIKISTITLLSLFMLISICFFRSYYVIASILITGLKSYILEKTDSTESYHYRNEGMSSYSLLCSSLKVDHMVAYKYYKDFEEKIKNIDKLNEFSFYLCIVIGTNLLSKGILHELLLTVNESQIHTRIAAICLILLLFVLSKVIIYHSIGFDRKINLYGIDEKAIEKH